MADNTWDVPNPGVNTRRWLIAGAPLDTAGRRSGSIMSLEKEPTLSITGMPKFRCFQGLETLLVPPIVRGRGDDGLFPVGRRGLRQF